MKITLKRIEKIEKKTESIKKKRDQISKLLDDLHKIQKDHKYLNYLHSTQTDSLTQDEKERLFKASDIINYCDRLDTL